jgi:hypothetical protein
LSLESPPWLFKKHQIFAREQKKEKEKKFYRFCLHISSFIPLSLLWLVAEL